MTEQNSFDQPVSEGQQQPDAVVGRTDTPQNAPVTPSSALPQPSDQLSEQLSSGTPAFEEGSPWAAAVDTPEPVLPVNWTASEFIAHHKTARWYGVLAAGALGGAFLVWLLTRDKISAAVVLFGALMFGVYANRQPRQLQYLLDGSGLTIDTKYYPYDTFRSFSVIDEGVFSSIMFIPLKRFAPGVSIYFVPQDEAAIITLLSDRLPSEDRGHDPLDRLMNRIRF